MENLLARALETIQISSIQKNPRKLRVYKDSNAFISLKESLKRTGNIEPIVVRLIDAEAGTYEVVVGNRRLSAMIDIGWETVQAIVVSLNDQEAFDWMLSENEQRDDLSYIEITNGIVLSLDLILKTKEEYLRKFTQANHFDRVFEAVTLAVRVEEKLLAGHPLTNEEDDHGPIYGLTLEFFEELPKLYKMKSFLRNDMKLIRELDPEVEGFGTSHELTRTQISGWNKLKKSNLEEYLKIYGQANDAETEFQEKGFLADTKKRRFQDISGTELSAKVNKTLKTQVESAEKELLGSKPPLNVKQKIYLYKKMGIPQEEIALWVNMTVEEVSNHIMDLPFLAELDEKIALGKTPDQLWKETDYHFLLLWNAYLKNKTTDLEKAAYLKWNIDVTESWSQKKEDNRFQAGELELSMETVANILYYYVRPEQTTLDFITTSSVIPQACLLLNRKNAAFSPDPENTNPFLRYKSQEANNWSYPLKLVADWVFFHPPEFWLAQTEDPWKMVKNFIDTMITTSLCRNVVFFVRPPFERGKVIKTFWDQGWTLEKVIEHKITKTPLDKTTHANLIADRKLMADTASILILKN